MAENDLKLIPVGYPLPAEIDGIPVAPVRNPGPIFWLKDDPSHAIVAASWPEPGLYQALGSPLP